MKTFLKSISTAALGVALVLTASPAPAADFTVPTQSSVTPKSALVGPITCLTAVSNLTAAVLITNAVPQGKHLGIGMRFVGRDATNTGTIGLRFKVQFGTNTLTTTTPFTVTSTANGTTAVNDWAVLPDYTVGPADKIVLAAVTNALANVAAAAAGCVVVSNVWLEYRN